jgi:hypothetical protein
MIDANNSKSRTHFGGSTSEAGRNMRAASRFQGQRELGVDAHEF